MISKKKLCYIAPYYSADDATHFSHLYDFIEEAAKVFDIALFIEKGSTPEKDFGCRIVKKLYFQKSFLRLCELKCRLLYIRLHGYKTVYVHYSFLAAFAAAIVMRPLGGKVFYWNCGEPWKYERSFIREFFEKTVYRMINFLVTGTSSLRKKYAETYRIPESKILVMPNWISLKRFLYEDKEIFRRRLSLGIPPGARVVLFAHRLSSRKGVHIIPEIIKAFERDNAFFIIIGHGPEEKSLRLEIKSLKLENAVKVLGGIPNHAMPNYYALSDAFIMPSEEEGFPRVILEAMAMQVPFVAFDVGAIKEITPPELHQFIVPAGDQKAFMNTLHALLSLPTETKSRIQQVEQEWVKRYSVENVVKKFSEIILQ